MVIDRDGLFHWDNKKKLVLKVVSALDLNELENNVAKPVTKYIDQTLTTGDNYGMLDASVSSVGRNWISDFDLFLRIEIRFRFLDKISKK